MSQFLAPLFGEYDGDQTIARASAAQPGLTVQPTLVQSSTGSGSAKRWTVGIGVNTARGFWAWRTVWTKDKGAFQILEDDTLSVLASQLEPAAGLTRHILVVGRWGWIAGPVDGGGNPLGVFTTAQHAVYEILSGADSSTPTDPAVDAVDSAGRPPVILARIVFPQGGTPSIEFLPDTMLDLAAMGLAIDARHKKTGDEVHTGSFQVTAAPNANNDVVRFIDILSRSVKPNASFLAFNVIVPDAWGSPAAVQAIPPPQRKAASGTDLQHHASDNTMIQVETAGIYLFQGVGYSQYNISQHDIVFQIVRRPVGTSGSADETFFSNGMPNNSGGISLPVMSACSANVGDLFYFKAVGKRSYSVDMVVSFMGIQAATLPLTITTPDWSGMEAYGQTYPKIITVPNTMVNNTGAVTWSITGGSASGFTTMDSAGVMTVNIPSTGSWTLDLHCVDSLGVVATHTATVTLAAYAIIPLVVTNTTPVHFTANTYSYAVDVALTSTGGQPAITWTVVVGADTTLPSAAITGGTHLTGTASAAGTWTAKVRATDSATSSQIVDKILTITVADYVDPGGGGGSGGGICFEASETYVWMADGTGKLLHDVQPGERVSGISAEAHMRGMRSIQTTIVTDKTLIAAAPGDPNGRIIEGIKSTKAHPWAVPGAFGRAEHISAGDTIIGEADGLTQDHTVATATDMSTPVAMTSTLGTTLGTFFVGATPAGPWFLVHNISMY